MLLPYVPFPLTFGGAIRCFHLLRALALRHRVEVAAFGTAHSAAALRRALGAPLSGIRTVAPPAGARLRRVTQLASILSGRSYFSLCTASRAMRSTVREILDRRPADVIHSEFYFMSAYADGGGALKVVDAHNVEYDVFRRLSAKAEGPLRRRFYRVNASAMRAEELAAYRRHDRVLCVSERDRSMLRLDLPAVPIAVVPNGVDSGHFRVAETPSRSRSIVFTGMMGYVPNYDGVLHFLDDIFPLVLAEVPDATLTIVGGSPPRSLLERASANVIVTGSVTDVRPYLQGARVAVVPLRMGGGTRLKVLEAMAMGKPTVSTSIGCEGIDVEHGVTGFIEDDPRSFSRRVVEILRDDELVRRIARNGREFVTARYDWDVIGDRVAGVYDGLRSRGNGRGGHKPDLRTGVCGDA